MEHIIPLSAAMPDPHHHVVALRCADKPHFDPDPLLRLFAERREAEAEEVVCRALEDIAIRLDELQKGLASCDFDKMQKPARRIGTFSDQLGLTEVSVAANHVLNCLNQADGIALEATMARLERGFDVAVAEVWNFRDHE